MNSLPRMILKDCFAMIFKRPHVKQIQGVVAILRDYTCIKSEEMVMGMAQFMGRFFLPSSSFICLVGNNSIEQCRRNAQFVLSSVPKVELIVAIGPMSAQALAYVSGKTGLKKATVFLNVQDPVATGLVSQDKKSGMFFGLVDTTRPEDYLTPLPTLLPNAQHALVLYCTENETEHTEREQENVMRFFQERGITYTPLKMPSLQSIPYHLRQALKGICEKEKTVVVVMPHRALMNSMSLISRMAASHDVVLYSLETEVIRHEYEAMSGSPVDSCHFGQRLLSHALDSIDAPHGTMRRTFEYRMKHSIMIQRNTTMHFHLNVEDMTQRNNIFWI